MSDYKVGPNKPPLHTRFKKGDRANPRGRGAKQTLRAGKIYDDVINGTIEAKEGGKKKRITKLEYMAKSLAMEAANGKIQSAELLLELYHHSKEHGDYKHVPVAVEAWEKEAEGRSRNWLLSPSENALVAAAKYQKLLDEL